MSGEQQYEAVIGLEVHARLLTRSKLFSSDANAYGAKPNENISVITLAHPGTLPKTNSKAIEYAVMKIILPANIISIPICQKVFKPRNIPYLFVQVDTLQ